MAEHHSIEHAAPVTGASQQPQGALSITTADVRDLLSKIANVYPDTAKALDAASRLIVHLESLRHEAIIPLSLGNTQGTLRLLKQPASVEVIRG